MNDDRMGNTVQMLVGFVTFAIAVVFIGIGLSEVGHFIEPQGFVMVVGQALALVLIGTGADGMNAVNGFIRNTGDRAENAKMTMLVCDLFGWGAFIGGFIAFMVGAINMLLAGMDDYNAMCMGFAIAIMTIFYGLVFLALAYALKAVPRRVLIQLEKERVRDE